MPRNRKKLFEAWFDLYVFAFKLQVILIGLFMLYSLTAGAERPQVRCGQPGTTITKDYCDYLEKEMRLAIYENNVPMVEYYIEAGGDLNYQTKKLGLPVLEVAIVKNRTEIAKLLIQAGADVNIRNIYRETPLYAAVSKSNYEIVRLLLLKGVRVNLVGNTRVTVLRVASNMGDVKMFNLLKAAGGKFKGVIE